MLRKLLICAALVAGSAGANAGPLLLDEGFNDLVLPDWYYANLTNPGSLPWFQGNTGIFDAADGPADSYVAANFTAAGAANSIDAWLLTPLMTVTTGVADLTFSTKTAGGLGGDSIEVLVSSGDTFDLNSYVSLGVIAAGSYPADWTAFTFRYYGAAADVRFAFRYLVDDLTVHGDYIGIDSVTVYDVPEPGTLALLAVGMLLAPLMLRRRRAKI